MRGAAWQRHQEGAALSEKAAQTPERASINLLGNYREREGTEAGQLWRHVIGRRLGLPGGEEEEVICPTLSSLLLKVDCSTVSPLHLSSFTCSADKTHRAYARGHNSPHGRAATV